MNDVEISWASICYFQKRGRKTLGHWESVGNGSQALLPMISGEFQISIGWHSSQTSHVSPATSPLPRCPSEYPLPHHKCLFNCRVSGSESWSQLIRPVTTSWLILTQLCSPVWLAAQLPICACGAGRRTLPPLCQHRLTLAKALVSLQLKELEPAFRQLLSVQSQH